MKTMLLMMKTLVAVAIVALVFSSSAVEASQGSFAPDECCFDFMTTRLRKGNVVNFKFTHHQCPIDGVFFTMKNGNVICVKPSVPWVKNIIQAKVTAQKTTTM